MNKQINGQRMAMQLEKGIDREDLIVKTYVRIGDLKLRRGPHSWF